jgi:hypothetical protein
MTFDNWEGYCTSCTHFIDWHIQVPSPTIPWFRCRCGCEITRAAAQRMRTDATVAYLVERLSADEAEGDSPCPSCGQPTWDNGVVVFHCDTSHDDTCAVTRKVDR